MRAYGLSRYSAGDVDSRGCACHGRATRVYSLTGRSHKALRQGKKAKVRRYFKRKARAAGKGIIFAWLTGATAPW